MIKSRTGWAMPSSRVVFIAVCIIISTKRCPHPEMETASGARRRSAEGQIEIRSAIT